MICDWKFDIMAVTLFNRLWKEKGEAIIEAYEIYNRNFVDESSASKEEVAGIEGKLDRAKNRLNNLICMRADGEISKDEYSEMKSRCEAEIEKLQKELTSIVESDIIETRKEIDVNKIKARLQQLTIYNDGKVPSEIIEAFVAAIIPQDDGKHFSWYLTLDDDEYHQSFCTLEGRKNTLKLNIEDVEEEQGQCPTFFSQSVLRGSGTDREKPLSTWSTAQANIRNPRSKK